MQNSQFSVVTIDDDKREVNPGRVLDNSNADSFSALLMELYDSQVRTVLIDVAGLEFLSSAGVGSILGTVELFRERDGDIVLAGASDKIRHILDVLNLTEYLTLCKTNEEARSLCGAQ